MSLNKYQQKAISYVSGPCLVLAGAGSGKTKVIINKIIYLINKYNYSPKNIVAITFTNKAACEIKSRISKILPLNIVNNINIFTFHALGFNIISSEFQSLNMKSNFSVINEHDQISILKEIIFKEDILFLKQIRETISNWKNKLIDPKQAEKKVNSVFQLNISRYYKIYNDYLHKFNILDFDDLIFLPVLLLQKNKEIRKSWSKKIQYLLVDEYQDTNFMQYELIKLLSDLQANFTLVGDDDQSIYSWRGANFDNFLFLKRDYPQLNIITLQHNYRSSGRILKVANSLISHNPHLFKKKLFSNFEDGPLIQIIPAKHEDEETSLVLKTITKHKALKNSQYKDYAILYRNNYQSNIFEKKLIEYRIPYLISTQASFFLRPEIKDIISYLRLIINPNDDLAFLSVINKPSRRIGLLTLKKLKIWRETKKKVYFLLVMTRT